MIVLKKPTEKTGFSRCGHHEKSVSSIAVVGSQRVSDKVLFLIFQLFSISLFLHISVPTNDFSDPPQLVSPIDFVSTFLGEPEAKLSQPNT